VDLMIFPKYPHGPPNLHGVESYDGFFPMSEHSSEHSWDQFRTSKPSCTILFLYYHSVAVSLPFLQIYS